MRKRTTDMSTPRVHLTLKSGNGKTGPIPVSTTESASCPACAFKGNGCYAETGPLRMHWDRVDKGKLGVTWQEFCDAVAKLPAGTLWRHNQAGDLPHNDGVIDSEKLALLVGANANKRGFTYTHHTTSYLINLRLLQAANWLGFTVNLSVNSPVEVDALAHTLLPLVCVLPADQKTNSVTPGGRPIVVCPATIRDDVTCMSCQLCAERDRAVVIGFPAHGGGKGKIQKMFFMEAT